MATKLEDPGNLEIPIYTHRFLQNGSAQEFGFVICHFAILSTLGYMMSMTLVIMSIAFWIYIWI